ncbi:MAG: hypothetical protein EOP85_05440 [Verrucomicrobiaceae bacterium]|nr:MAG: hypothetical protein EOP85_05440 [Verrucomicrobiaceae bacterium]
MQAKAELLQDGTVKLSAAGREASGKRDGLLGKNPQDGLSVGDDSGPPVGPYQESTAYKSTIRSVRIGLGKR